ncbi:hypothetical protein SprV_0200970500 [Sparganum proliferum]
MASHQTFLSLNSGFKIPQVGFGSFMPRMHEVEDPVLWAIDAGYRHIDCARAYQNESEVGRALSKKLDAGTVKREDLFITSKLKEGTQFPVTDPSAFEFEYIPLEETWKGMEELVEAGLVKSIGVSNFNRAQIDRILAVCKIPPAVNQIEVTVNWLNQKLIDYCHSKGIQITAYSPFGSPGLMKDMPSPLEEEYVKKIALVHRKTPGQVLLRHAIQRGLSVVANSSKKERIQANFNVFDFTLTTEEMETLNTSGRNARVFDAKMVMTHPEYPYKAEF